MPAVVDEIVNRAEFVTAYYGETYTDHGKLQAFFEYASLIGELVELDAVSQPTYDWATAAASAIAMAGRVTGRSRALVPASMGPERRRVVEGVCAPRLQVDAVPYETATGQLDLAALEAALRDDVACVYVENPTFLGVLEAEAPAIMAAAHAAGALGVVGVDPISLGRAGGAAALRRRHRLRRAPAARRPPALRRRRGGVHRDAGRGALRRRVPDVPDRRSTARSRASGASARSPGSGRRTCSAGTRRTSRAPRRACGPSRSRSYLSLLGPHGLAELGEGLMQRTRYAAQRLAEVAGVRVPRLAGTPFKEFVVAFDDTGWAVADVNAALRKQGIFGGHDLSRDFPELGQSALYSFTEQHTQADIDRLVDALAAATA